MIIQDEALTISNPRLLSAVYFSLLAIVATLVIDSILYALGMEQIVPTFKAILLAAIIAACFGALFGARIVYSEKPYRKHAFFWAFLMVIVALPVYNIGLLFLLKEQNATLFANATLARLLYLYLFVLVYSFIIAGVWFAIVAGIAAVYLRSHLVYYILHSLSVRRKTPTEQVIRQKTPQSGEGSITSHNNDNEAP